MNVDKVSRGEAKRIRDGQRPRFFRQPHPKTEFYGLLGRVLDVEQTTDLLDGVPSVNAFINIRDMLNFTLRPRVLASHAQLDASTKGRMEASLLKRNKRWLSGVPTPFVDKLMVRGDYTFTKQRLLNGVDNGALAATIVLRTFAQRLSQRSVSEAQDAPVTREALDKSHRLTYQLAMMHLLGFGNVESEELWGRDEGGDGGTVISARHAAFDPKKGLYLLKGSSLGLPKDLAKAEKDGPRIGCPTTFIEAYIEGMHLQAAGLAIRSGLIQL